MFFTCSVTSMPSRHGAKMAHASQLIEMQIDVFYPKAQSLSVHLSHYSSVNISTTSSYKYLGLILTSSLSWITHIETIRRKAARSLGYLQRNLKKASPEVKKLAYVTFVPPQLEFASSVWHPSQDYLAASLESVQNRATRFITSDYSRYTSVTSLKQTIRLQTLKSCHIILGPFAALLLQSTLKALPS